MAFHTSECLRASPLTLWTSKSSNWGMCLLRMLGFIPAWWAILPGTLFALHGWPFLKKQEMSDVRENFAGVKLQVWPAEVKDSNRFSPDHVPAAELSLWFKFIAIVIISFTIQDVYINQAAQLIKDQKKKSLIINNSTFFVCIFAILCQSFSCRLQYYLRCYSHYKFFHINFWCLHSFILYIDL